MINRLTVQVNGDAVERVATLLSPHWTEGQRNDLILPLSGLLLRHVSLADAERVVAAICTAANDDEAPDRLSVLRHTSDRLSAGEPCRGGPALAKALGDGGESTVGELLALLGGNSSSSSTGSGFNGRPRRKSYPTRRAAIEAIDTAMRGEGLERTDRWNYRDGDGRLVASVLRFDGNGGAKGYRPISRHSDSWLIADPPGPWPLYRQPELADAKRVFICEGEKCSDLVRRLGLYATTSAHGSRSARKTDWAPLAGREIALVPDYDGPGADYAEDVADIVLALDPPAAVKVIDLEFPGRGPGDDVEQWLAYYRQQGEDDEQLRARLEALADAAPVEEPDQPAEPHGYLPFPLAALPEPVQTLVREGALALGCDPAFVALPALAVVAGLTGNTRAIRLKPDWTEPAVVWAAVVAPSGTQKSPAARLALGPLIDVQRKFVEAHRLALQAHETAKAAHEAAAKAFAKATGPDPGPAPTAPVCERHVVSDVTIERLAEILEDNPRGLLLYRDELAGWVHNFGRYRSGGSDLPAWLSMHRADAILVDRKGDNRKTTYVARAAVSVTGGIQPGTLARVLATPEAVESGLLARLLLARPPRTPKTWTEAAVSPATHQRYAELFPGLLILSPAHLPDGTAVPYVLTLDDDARRLWIDFYQEWADEQALADEALAAALSKLEGYAARLALIHHVVEHVGLGADDRCPVSRRSVAAGILLTRWFANEARRLYGELEETEAERATRRLVEYIQARGGAVTARELCRSSRRYRTMEEAAQVLDALAKAGLGEWAVRPTTARGGRPVREMRLREPPGRRLCQRAPTEPPGVPTQPGPEKRRENKGKIAREGENGGCVGSVSATMRETEKPRDLASNDVETETSADRTDTTPREAAETQKTPRKQGKNRRDVPSAPHRVPSAPADTTTAADDSEVF
jgi:hypothetical protein